MKITDMDHLKQRIKDKVGTVPPDVLCWFCII